MTAKKVFISYSHDSPEHSERVLSLAWALRNNGIDVDIDQFHKEEIVDWPRWCNEQTSREHSEFVVCVCTAEYKRRLDGHVPPEKGKGVYWEGSLIDDDVYDEKGNSRLIPILFDDEADSSIPRFLRGWTHCRLRQFALNEAGYEHLIRILTGQASVEKNPLGTIPVLPTKRSATEPQSLSRAGFKADISRIIDYAPAELIGRETEFKILSDAWQHAVNGEPKRPHILTFVALGGEGKTSLVAKWAAELAHQDWHGCDVAFAWSFYREGTDEKSAASSDLFLKEALEFFGDAATASSAEHATVKGKRLAQLVGERRALLILDGVEPLQYPPSSVAFSPGQLKDQGIAKLLKDLATTSRGLCLITTRYSLPDLNAFMGNNVQQEKLVRLSRQHGVALLKKLGVQGSERRNLRLKDGDDRSEKVNEFEKLVEDVKGHALTLQIMGDFLKRAFNGDIRQRDRVEFEKADEKIDGGHAFRAMAAYAKWMEGESEEAKRELAILRLMGLFDRPATRDCLEALLKPPAIAGLTEPLVGLAQDDWQFSLDALNRANLLTLNHDSFAAVLSLDTHPHIREYFAKELRVKNPVAWREGHRRLYEHLRDTTHEGNQPTLEDLQPLYQAVAHGCQAGLHLEARTQILRDRIQRVNEYYSFRKLGAFGTDLGALACFFDEPWKLVAPELPPTEQALVLNQTSGCLQALGRLIESLAPSRAALEMRIKEENWRGAATIAGNVGELELTLGDVAEALRAANKSLTYAERSKDLSERIKQRVKNADAIYQSGHRSEAQAHFLEAEQMLAAGQPAHLLLPGLAGSKFCDLLLAASEGAAWQRMLGARDVSSVHSLSEHEQACRAVSERATQTLKWSNDVLDSSVDHLSLGRAALFTAIFGGGPDSFRNERPDKVATLQTARRELDAAVDGLRRSGMMVELPRGLLARAWLSFFGDDHKGAERARTDLDEAWEIAERGPMRLFMADIHLYRARLFHAVKPYPWSTFADGSEGRGPKDDLADARKLIEQCGYWRRKEELEDAEEAAKSWT